MAMFSAHPAALPTLAHPDADPRRWLEDVDGALDWVRAKNDDALATLGDPKQSPTYTRILNILDSKEKIPYVGRVLNNLYYNFWQDDTHVRGIWRRCTLDEYRKPSPAWETVLDLDALSNEESVTWVWAGSIVLDEGASVPTDRVLIKLSDGGSDANHVRELDINTKKWILAAEGGFVLPESKSSVSWKDRDTLLVGGSLFGESAVTDSGYARTVREWKRGTPYGSSVEVYAGERADVQAGGCTYLDRAHRISLRYRAPSFYSTLYLAQLGPEGFGADEAAKGYRKVLVPADAELGTFADQVLITLRTEWLGYKAGSLLAAGAAPLLAAADEAAIKPLLTPLFEPTPTCSLEGDTGCQNYVILQVLESVKAEVRFWRYEPTTKAWTLKHTLRGTGVDGVISASPVNGDRTDAIWTTSSSYTQPTTYSLAHADAPTKQEELKALPAMFDASGLHAQQFYATSKDGTQIPYFLVMHKDRPLDGSTPTLLYGYGGFEISETPGYMAATGVGWLEKGNAFAVANIRGGGEFGPTWHQAALKEKRHKGYEDFEAVAEDLCKRGVAKPAKLGVQGGSNGGLLTGNMITRRPELFGAIVSEVPLLDMRTYNKLLAGASWMEEYGNPDVPEEWDYLRHNSPYHTLAVGKAVPPTLFTTSTRDDRVHPAHARKLAGKMYDLGMPVLSYENIEGGHGGAADNKQRAFMTTLMYSFLQRALVDGSLGAELTSRPPADGGCRRLANVSYRAKCLATGLGAGVGAKLRGLPKCLAPTITAVALAALVATQRRRLR